MKRAEQVGRCAPASCGPAPFRRIPGPALRHRLGGLRQAPVGGPKQVLSYLARYTHRIAISNHRLLRLDGDQVVFTWRDRAHGDRQRTMRLPAHEFLRCFLLHVLPDDFVRIRY
jgi:hypothetical protein